MQHLCTIDDLGRDQLHTLIEAAKAINPRINQNTLAGKSIALCFFEPSTRTRLSFELAAKRLGAHVLNLGDNTSLSKGETIIDTCQNIAAMGVDAIVVRHKENGMAQRIADAMPHTVHIVNGGDGTHAHPSQALLDMLTIAKHTSEYSKLKIAIVGDLKHSRVARSQIAALQMLGVRSIHLVAPTALQLDICGSATLRLTTDLREGLTDADVVITLRTQAERFGQEKCPSHDTYHNAYGITEANLAWAKPNAILMHPGPIIRGLEINDAAADGPQSVILEQVTNGVAVRMAIFASLLSNPILP